MFQLASAQRENRGRGLRLTPPLLIGGKRETARGDPAMIKEVESKASAPHLFSFWNSSCDRVAILLNPDSYYFVE